MTVSTPEFRADRLAWSFRRSGGDGEFLREFMNLDETLRSKLAESANLGTDEIPAIGCYFNSHSWLLVTSHRLVWMSAEHENSLSLDEVTDATISPQDLLAAGGKDRLRQLTVVATDRRFSIPAEAGPPLSGLWNALKMAATMK